MMYKYTIAYVCFKPTRPAGLPGGGLSIDLALLLSCMTDAHILFLTQKRHAKMMKTVDTTMTKAGTATPTMIGTRPRGRVATGAEVVKSDQGVKAPGVVTLQGPGGKSVVLTHPVGLLSPGDVLFVVTGTQLVR